MKAKERVENYLKQFNIQRLKVLHAYGKMLSYYSKLTTNEELVEVMSEEEKQELAKIAREAKRLFKRMDSFVSKRW